MTARTKAVDGGVSRVEELGETVLPLTPAQRELWLATLARGDGTSYAVAEVTHIQGPLDVEAWLAAADDVLRDVPALRMRLDPDGDDGLPRARFDAVAERASYLDLRAEAGPVAAADAWVADALTVPLDPRDRTVSHAVLLRTGDETWRWFLRVHHVAADGYGFALLGTLLARAYEQRLGGAHGGDDSEQEDGPDTESLARLAEVTRALCAQEGSDAAAADRAYWRTQEPSVPTVALAPSPTPDGAGAHPAAVVREAVRPSLVSHPDPAVLVTALAVLTTALTGRADVVVGVHAMSRPDRALLRTVCTAQNLLPVRVEVDPDRSVGDLLDAVTAAWQEARRHGHARHEAVRRDRGLSGDAALCDVALNVVPFARSVHLGEAVGRAAPVWDGPVDGLCLDARPTSDVEAGTDGLSLVAPAGALPAVTLHGMATTLARLVDALRRASRPGAAADVRDLRVRDLDLGGLEQDGTVATSPIGCELPEDPTWAVGVLDRPGDVARPGGIHAPEGTLTREECAARVNRLARQLRASGVGADDRVLVVLPRSADAVLAPLAVLQAGAAYVPCDTDWPPARFATVLALVRPALVVTTRAHAATFTGAGAEVLALDDAAGRAAVDARSPGPVHDAERSRPVRADDPAYILFTSGSTGIPKGVVVAHHALANFARTLRELYLPQERAAADVPDDAPLTVVHEHSVAFDSNLAPVVRFCAGYRLLVPTSDDLGETHRHARYLRAHRPDVLDVAPAVLSELLAHGIAPGEADARHRPMLTTVVVGGDACPAPLWQQLRALTARGVLAANAYGPTENTVDATVAWIGAHPEPSLGHPLPRQRAQVRDPWGRLLPAGLPGELWLAGASLAQGYLDDPGTTADRFVHLPDVTRAYRTGDRARQEVDGSLTFLGRTDSQVSVRGVRLEIGEVEAALCLAPGVQHAVVSLDGEATEVRLVAHVVGTAAPGWLDAAAEVGIRRSLRARLPAACIPSAIVEIPFLPLTDRGKVDRRALPAPTVRRSDGAPWPQMSEHQRAVAAVISDLLDLPLDELRTRSDLFALGGHSLTAVRVVSRLAEAGLDGATLRDVLADPTIEGIASLLHDAPAASATTADQGLTLTDAQLQLWLLEQSTGPSGTYAIPVALDVDGHLDLAALTEALHDTVLNHPTLHHTYPAGDDGLPAPRRASEDAVRRAVRPRTCSLDPGDPHLATHVDTTLDLTRDLPIRVHVVSDDARHTVLLVLHHVAADGTSLVPLLRTLATAYRSRRAGLTPDLPGQAPVPAPTRVTPEDLARRSAALAGLPEVLELPLDRARPAVRDHRGGEVRRTLEIGLGRAVHATAEACGTTPFVLVQAVLAGLLSRCGAGEDVPLGTVFGGREAAGAEDVVTNLAATLVLRVDTSGDPTFAELVARSASGTRATLADAHVPFSRLVETIAPARSPQHHPLFQVMLVAQTVEDARFDGGPGEPTVSVRVLGNGTAKFDLTCELFVGARDEAVRLRWEFARDVFDEETVHMLADGFETLLRHAVEDPTARLWSRPLSMVALDAAHAEGARMSGFRAAQDAAPWPSALPPEPTLAGAVEHALVRHGTATALVERDGSGQRSTVSYTDLAERSGRVRDVLVARGIGPGDLVGLLVPRSSLQVEAVLGVLRAGAAYLPLDPHYPVERLAATLAEAHPAALLVAGDACPPSLRDAVGGTVLVDFDADLDLDLDLDLDVAGAVVRAAGVPGRDDPAYVIFTSGSTGRPKGVVVPQTHVPRLLRSTDDRFGFGPGDVWTLFHSYAFDFAVWEMFGALLTGGTLVVVPPGVARSPAEMLRLLRDENVTVLSQTPSAFGQLVRADASKPTLLGEAPTLRTIVLGGEAMDPAVVRDWFTRHRPGTPEVVNMYGITETTVHVTYLRLEEDIQGRSPVGEPIPDLSVYLLDRGGHPVPDGVVGEVHVGGAGVSAGYLGRPELTAERFPPDPFAPTVAGAPAPRMYRSGDLAVRTRAGVLDFRGRADRQVQLRGFRIELGDVEAAAACEPGVKLAHARVVSYGVGDDRLVVDVVGPDPATADPVALRRTIAARLPAQMAPAAVMVLAEVPLTVNGKLDESALPVPTLLSRAGREPCTATERTVCELYAEVLGLDRCGPDDGFFDLGGHSLLAVTLVARIRARLDAELRVGTLLGAQTPAQLAAHLDGNGTVDEEADLRVLLPLRTVPPERRRGGGAVFCLHPAGGLSWCYAGLPLHLPESLPVWGLQARGVLDPEAQPGSLAQMAEDYIAEMRRVEPDGPYHLVGWSLGGMVAQVMAARLQARGLPVGAVALLDAYPSEAETGVGEPPLGDALSAVLAMAGLDDVELAGRATEVASLAEILSERSSPMSGLSVGTLGALVRTYRNTARILREFRHEPYDGDVVFLRAGRAGRGPHHDPDEWRQHLGGTMTVVDVDCTHREMTLPGPLRVVGQEIARTLGA